MAGCSQGGSKIWIPSQESHAIAKIPRITIFEPQTASTLGAHVPITRYIRRQQDSAQHQRVEACWIWLPGLHLIRWWVSTNHYDVRRRHRRNSFICRNTNYVARNSQPLSMRLNQRNTGR